LLLRLEGVPKHKPGSCRRKQPYLSVLCGNLLKKRREYPQEVRFWHFCSVVINHWLQQLKQQKVQIPSISGCSARFVVENWGGTAAVDLGHDLVSSEEFKSGNMNKSHRIEV
jgi:hypothetical protein